MTPLVIIRKYVRLEDGSFKFDVSEKPPRKLLGYRNTDDPFLFIPDFDPCPHRIHGMKPAKN